jgi:hypothetical protein
MSTKLNMSKINQEEVSVWNDMKLALNAHNSYYVRQPFYPHNMDSWEKEHKDLEHQYHEKLKNMISMRVKLEMEAAQTLVMLQHREVNKVKRIANKEKAEITQVVPRRSSRISLRC